MIKLFTTCFCRFRIPIFSNAASKFILTKKNQLQNNLWTGPRTTDTQWRHKSKISEKLGRCGRQNMLPPYLKIWEWEWIFGRAVKAISTLGVRSPWLGQCPREYIHDFVLIRQIPLGLIYGQQGINSLKFPFHALHFVKSTFFPYCPELPKRLKQKNSC